MSYRFNFPSVLSLNKKVDKCIRSIHIFSAGECCVAVSSGLKHAGFYDWGKADETQEGHET